MYEIKFEYANRSPLVIVCTDGKHSVAGFLLDALEKHEAGTHKLLRVELTDVTPPQPPISFERRLEADVN